MLSFGMLLSVALSTASRNRGFMSGSPPPMRAATVTSLIRRVKTLPRLASWRPLRCWMFAHLLCPAMVSLLEARARRERWSLMVTFASRPSPERNRATGGKGTRTNGEDRRAQGADPADPRIDAGEPEGRAHHHGAARRAPRRFRG